MNELIGRGLMFNCCLNSQKPNHFVEFELINNHQFLVTNFTDKTLISLSSTLITVYGAALLKELFNIYICAIYMFLKNVYKFCLI